MADLIKNNRLAYNKYIYNIKINYRFNVRNVNNSHVTGICVYN
jgi:hypothetical protein